MKYAVLALLICSRFATAADDADSKKLLKEIEGNYKVTAAERSGDAPPTGFLESIEKVSIKGNKFSITFKAEGKTEDKMATVTVDAGKKPAHIDLKPDDGPKKDQLVLGIVVVDGDTIKVCWNDAPEAKRPTEFKTSKDDKNMLLTLKKAKE